HGFFAQEERLREAQIDPLLFERGRFDRQAGARSPLARCGLVLAGHNLTGEKAPADGGLLTGEAGVGARAERPEAAGRGARGGRGAGGWGVRGAGGGGLGEMDARGGGAFALSRAFHPAGARHVVSSLWEVDDQATYALMLLFYRKLWAEGKEPLAALREAQLEMYRRPELVAELGKRRGGKLLEADWPELKQRPAGKGKTAPVSAWAAFSFSGSRR